MKIIRILIFLALIAVTSSPEVVAETTWESVIAPASISSIAATPLGLLAGERSSYTPFYNGLWLSEDLGKSWSKFGLEKHGVTDVKYFEGKLYAATYYSQESGAGLYISSDYGKSWIRSGPSTSAYSLYVDSNIIVLGSGGHGLWTSNDQGQNWSQKIGTNGSGPDVYYLKRVENTFYASTNYGIYKSHDSGETWTSTILPQSNVRDIQEHKSKWVFCLENSRGIQISADKGKTLTPSAGWPSGLPCRGMIKYQNALYATTFQNPNTKTGLLYLSVDGGTNWEDLKVTDKLASYMLLPTLYYSDQDYLFGIGNSSIVYRFWNLPNGNSPIKLFGKLWDNTDFSDQTNSITAYFDHTYPLLGYPYYQEPDSEKATTTNFSGLKLPEPDIYYSSHNGTDFGLPFGTEIKAPASGKASYSYGSDTGHTIKIDHQNGFQSVYMHLQPNELAVKDAQPKTINKGDRVGKVGISGRTFGPHLHFTVMKDANQDGLFNDFPYGLVDPYSWQNKDTNDPWETYQWNDALGAHQGAASPYLWESEMPELKTRVGEGSGTFSYKAFSLEINQDASNDKTTLKLKPYPQANALFMEPGMKAITSSFFDISLFNPTNEIVSQLNSPAKLIFHLDSKDILNIAEQTLSFYFFDQEFKKWQKIESFYDETINTLTAYTNHFSEFAVMGKKVFYESPVSSHQLVGGVKDEKWYIERPEIKLIAVSPDSNNKSLIKTFFSLDGGSSWEVYDNSMINLNAGVYSVLYRSADEYENYEDAKETELIRVAPTNKPYDEALIMDAYFTVAENFESVP